MSWVSRGSWYERRSVRRCVCLYRRQQQDEMIARDVMQWLVQLLRNCDMISDYMLEYAVALLMNLCLRTAGQ